MEINQAAVVYSFLTKVKRKTMDVVSPIAFWE